MGSDAAIALKFAGSPWPALRASQWQSILKTCAARTRPSATCTVHAKDHRCDAPPRDRRVPPGLSASRRRRESPFGVCNILRYKPPPAARVAFSRKALTPLPVVACHAPPATRGAAFRHA